MAFTETILKNCKRNYNISNKNLMKMKNILNKSMNNKKKKNKKFNNYLQMKVSLVNLNSKSNTIKKLQMMQLLF